MTRQIFVVLTMLLFLSTVGHAYIRDFSKVRHHWKAEDSRAYISGKAKFDDGTEVINIFVVDFDKELDCSPVFKIAFMDDYVYGELEKTVPIDRGALKLYVDNKVVFDGAIVNFVYSNGIEFGAVMTPELLTSISNGKYLTVELVDKMDILFNLNNAKEHIESAQQSCSQN